MRISFTMKHPAFLALALLSGCAAPPPLSPGSNSSPSTAACQPTKSHHTTPLFHGHHSITSPKTAPTRHTPIEQYDTQFADAIRQAWFNQIEPSDLTFKPGKIIVEFFLHSDGHISDFKIVKNACDEREALFVQKAILDSSPFTPWPEDLCHEINADKRGVRFTFYYEP